LTFSSARQSQIAYGKEDKDLFEAIFWTRITIVTVSYHANISLYSPGNALSYGCSNEFGGTGVYTIEHILEKN
jgi:hypothetical protein